MKILYKPLLYLKKDCDIFAITETWWDNTYNWSAALESYTLFRREKPDRRGGGVVLYVKAGFDCLEISCGD